MRKYKAEVRQKVRGSLIFFQEFGVEKMERRDA